MSEELNKNGVKKERFGTRDLGMSSWIRNNLPAKRFAVTDLDFCFFNYATKKFMLVEVKTRNGTISESQKAMFLILHKALQAGSIDAEMKYEGLHLLQLSNTEIDNSDYIHFDGKQVTKAEIKAILSLQ